MTNSLFEVNAAALALLILDKELPDKYSYTGVAIPYILSYSIRNNLTHE
jgi:hypothetical protein